MFRSMTCGSNESELPYSCIKIEEKIQTSAVRRVFGNGSETSERSNDGLMTVCGVVEGLGNGEALRSIRLTESPLSDVRTPQNKVKTSVTELLQSPVNELV